MRSLFIADEPMGFCGGCGIALDVGDWIAVREGIACHAKTCSPRPKAIAPPAPEAMLLFEDRELEVIEEAKTTIGASRIAFDGVSARPIDLPRLAGQMLAVYRLMEDGEYWTLSDLAGKVGGLETSISSRIRDMRKARWGSRKIETRYVGNGIRRYRLVPQEVQEDGQRAA